MMQAALGPKRVKVVAAIGMVTAGAVAVAAMTMLQAFFMAFFFGWFAWQNFQIFQRGHGSVRM
jgi:hypothetical protein